jgi:hypothetical protein
LRNNVICGDGRTYAGPCPVRRRLRKYPASRPQNSAASFSFSNSSFIISFSLYALYGLIPITAFIHNSTDNVNSFRSSRKYISFHSPRRQGARIAPRTRDQTIGEGGQGCPQAPRKAQPELYGARRDPRRRQLARRGIAVPRGKSRRARSYCRPKDRTRGAKTTAPAAAKPAGVGKGG